MVPFERVMVVPVGFPLCHCAISNHSTPVCHRMYPTLNSKRVGHFAAKFGEEGIDRCKPNFKVINVKNLPV